MGHCQRLFNFPFACGYVIVKGFNKISACLFLFLPNCVILSFTEIICCCLGEWKDKYTHHAWYPRDPSGQAEQTQHQSGNSVLFHIIRYFSSLFCISHYCLLSCPVGCTFIFSWVYMTYLGSLNVNTFLSILWTQLSPSCFLRNITKKASWKPSTKDIFSPKMPFLYYQPRPPETLSAMWVIYLDKEQLFIFSNIYFTVLFQPFSYNWVQYLHPILSVQIQIWIPQAVRPSHWRPQC